MTPPNGGAGPIQHALWTPGTPGVAGDDVVIDLGAESTQSRAREASYREAFERAPIGMAVIGRDGRFVQVNDAMCDVLGRQAAEVTRTPVEAAVHPDDRVVVLDAIASLLDGGGSRPFAARFVRPDATVRQAIVTASPIASRNGVVRALIAQVLDETERDAAAERLRVSEERYRRQAEILALIARRAPLGETLDAVARFAERGRPGAACAVVVADNDAVLGGAEGLPAGAVEAAVRRAASTASSAPAGSEGAVERLSVEDDPAWGDAGLREGWLVPVVASGDGARLGALVVGLPRPLAPSADDAEVLALAAQLVTIALEGTAAVDRLAHQAVHDPLTGLPNRLLLLDRLSHALARQARSGRSTAVLFCDLDRFKVINDSLGHAVGDTVLRTVAARLVSVMRPGDTVARFGGDEFVVLCEDLTEAKDAAGVADRVAQVLAAPVDLPTGQAHLTTSVGIAVATGGDTDADALVRDADAALYRAKDRGRARSELFDDDMRERAMSRLQVEADLRRAIDRHELVLHYQPAVSLTTGRVVGVEALVRWADPERATTLPRDFIPVAEETGLILPIGAWVLQEACRQAATWRNVGGHRLTMSVNLSARQLSQPDLAAQVAGVLDATRCPPEVLVLEITESVLLDDISTTVASLEALRSLGVGLAIDDFGTGYASLSYLRRFPVSMVKVDRSFVASLGRDRDDAAIVTAVIRMAHALGLTAVAEGVETADQVAALRALGCEVAQGFFFAPPLPADQVSPLLTDGRW